jgi:hypothetical protein
LIAFTGYRLRTLHGTLYDAQASLLNSVNTAPGLHLKKCPLPSNWPLWRNTLGIVLSVGNCGNISMIISKAFMFVTSLSSKLPSKAANNRTSAPQWQFRFKRMAAMLVNIFNRKAT